MLVANAYYLQDDIGQGAPQHVAAALDDARAMGFGAVRAWAFNDNPDKSSRMWNGLTEPVEAGFRALDQAVAMAAERQLRLILALHDYWPAYGGMAQWLRWRGQAIDNRANPSSYAARFYGDPVLRDAYRRRCELIIDRTNSVSGVRYGDDPTIAIWELMNEARAAPADWIAFAAESVRRVGRQLVALGDEDALDAPELDVASLHLYPEKAGAARGDEERFGLQRLTEAARRVTRPLVLGEFGLSAGDLSRDRRRAAYGNWLAHARDLRLAACAPWMLAYAARPDDFEHFSFYRGGEYDDVFAGAARALADT